MPPQSLIAASGLVMFSGFYPPATQVFTLSCIRHRRGFYLVRLNSKISRVQTLHFRHIAAEKASRIHKVFTAFFICSAPEMLCLFTTPL